MSTHQTRTSFACPQDMQRAKYEETESLEDLLKALEPHPGDDVDSSLSTKELEDLIANLDDMDTKPSKGKAGKATKQKGGEDLESLLQELSSQDSSKYEKPTSKGRSRDADFDDVDSVLEQTLNNLNVGEQKGPPPRPPRSPGRQGAPPVVG